MRISRLSEIMKEIADKQEQLRQIREEIKILKTEPGDNTEKSTDLYNKHTQIAREIDILDGVFDVHEDVNLYTSGRRMLYYGKNDSPEILARYMSAFPEDTKIVFKSRSSEFQFELMLENPNWKPLVNKNVRSSAISPLDDGKLEIKLDEIDTWFVTKY